MDPDQPLITWGDVSRLAQEIVGERRATIEWLMEQKFERSVPGELVEQVVTAFRVMIGNGMGLDEALANVTMTTLRLGWELRREYGVDRIILP